MKVVFLGNHNVGINVLHALLKKTQLVGIVAHPEDPEDGVQYQSVYEFAIKNNLPAIRSTGKSPRLFEFITSQKPDLLWSTDFRYILPESLVSLASLGAVNIHPSLLPKYRGRASINWAVINGEKEFGLTVHFIDNGVDTGDIIQQITIPIDQLDYIEDLLKKSYPLYFHITCSVIDLFYNNTIKRTVQTEVLPEYPRRTAKDGKINWNQSTQDIFNLIRAVSRPYPGAFTYFDNIQKIFIWRATPIFELEKHNNYPNGFVIESSSNCFKVKCHDGIIHVTDFSSDGNNFYLDAGCTLK